MSGDELYDQYSRYLSFLGLAAESQYQYLRIVDDYLAETGDDLTRDSVQSYMRKYEQKSGTYRRWIMYILKSLFENAKVEWPFVKRELPKLSKPSQPYLRVEDAEKLLAVAKKSSLLDYALVRLDAVTGARRKELASALLEDYVRPHIRIRTAKGGEERVRTLDDVTCAALDAYLKKRRSKSPALFVSSQGTPLTTQTLSTRFKALAKSAGFKKGTGWHSIRRGVTTWLFEGGMRERELQEALGWKSAVMPGKYVQLVAGNVEKQVIATHPFFKGGDSGKARAATPRPRRQTGAKRGRG